MTKTYKTLEEGRTGWAQDRATWEQAGVYLPGVIGYLPEAFKRNADLAMDSLAPLMGMDAQPGLATDPNSALPAMLTTLIDPTVFEVRFAPNKAVEIFGEQRRGDWTMDTAMFPIVEHAGEVTTYGDFNTMGHVTANMNWPQRQQYRYQTMIEYGELEMARAGLGKINWVSELDKSAATQMNKFENFVYFFGVSGLENYGLLNDPGLGAALTPATKAAGGTAWTNASANEIFNDVKAVITQLISQSAGIISKESAMTLALGPTQEADMAATNSFNVNVSDLLKKNYPNLKITTAVQYETKSAANPQGNAAGNLMQVIADDFDGQDVGFCSFGEKLRSHPIIRAESSYRQKRSGGAWGAIIRAPIGFAQMVGI